MEGRWLSQSSLVAGTLDTTVKCLNFINYVWKVGGDHQVLWLYVYSTQALNCKVYKRRMEGRWLSPSALNFLINKAYVLILRQLTLNTHKIHQSRITTHVIISHLQHLKLFATSYINL